MQWAAFDSYLSSLMRRSLITAILHAATGSRNVGSDGDQKDDRKRAILDPWRAARGRPMPGATRQDSRQRPNRRAVSRNYQIGMIEPRRLMRRASLKHARQQCR